jgi:hypothetical protein
MPVRKINPANTDRGADPYQVGPRQDPALRHGAKIVDLQFDGGETPRAGKVMLQCGADRRISNARRDAAMERSRGVQELGAYAALDCETIAMHANQLESQQMIEGMLGQKQFGKGGRAFRLAQVCDFSIVEARKK